MKSTLIIFRFLSSFILCFYPLMILLEKDIKSYIPLFVAVAMIVTYLALSKTTIFTSIIKLLASIVILLGMFSISYGATVLIQLLPQFPPINAVVAFVGGSCVLFLAFKFPGWLWEQ